MESRRAWEVPIAERHPLIRWAMKNDLMLKEICHGLGITRPTLSYWDRGRSLPSAPLRRKIVEYTKGAITSAHLINHWQVKRGEV